MSSEGDVIAGHKSIQEVIELQADLSEMLVLQSQPQHKLVLNYSH